MYLIVGLGNPGEKYENTRHNIGFQVIDKLCSKLNSEITAGKGSYFISSATFDSKKVFLLKPTTYMNLSGDAVQQVVHYFKISRSNIIVIADDINLKVGQIRLRESGSAGGHNGLSDIIQKLRSDQFIRVRCGVGNDFRPGQQADYVLSPFKSAEKEQVQFMIERASDASLSIIKDGLNKSMSLFNKTIDV